MKSETFPIEISEDGVVAKIRKIRQQRKDWRYTYYAVEYVLLGKRKQQWHADLTVAKAG